jgi:dolichol-phosphate mannosyltransferase
MHGTSKFGFIKYFSYATDGLVSGTITPLRLSVIGGVILSFMSFIFAGYFVVAKLFLGIPFATGVAAIIVIQLFGFGMTFLFLGVIGEYVGRLYLAKEASQLAIIEDKYPSTLSSTKSEETPKES